MPPAAGAFAFRRRRPSPEEEERAELLTALERTRTQINQAYACFNAARDGQLIESYVFEINALQARTSYLLRRLKELEGGALPASEAR